MGGFNPYILLLWAILGLLAMICHNAYYNYSNYNSNKGLLLETPADTVAVHKQDDDTVAKWFSETNEEKEKRNNEIDDGFESMDVSDIDALKPLKNANQKVD